MLDLLEVCLSMPLPQALDCPDTFRPHPLLLPLFEPSSLTSISLIQVDLIYPTATIRQFSMAFHVETENKLIAT